MGVAGTCGVKTLLIEPGNPWKDGYVESFTGSRGTNHLPLANRARLDQANHGYESRGKVVLRRRPCVATDCLPAVILGSCCCLPIAVRAASGVEGTQFSSSTGDLESPNTGNQQPASLILDVDCDLANDFVIAERTQAPAVVWYRRVANGWSRYVLESGTLVIKGLTTK